MFADSNYETIKVKEIFCINITCKYIIFTSPNSHNDSICYVCSLSVLLYLRAFNFIKQ